MANGTDDSALTDLICKLYNDSMAFARSEEFLYGLASAYCIDNGLKDHPWGKVIIEYAKETVQYCLMLCAKMNEAGLDDPVVGEKYGAGIANNTAMLEKLERVITGGSWDEIRNAVNSFSVGSLGRLPNKYSSAQAESVKAQRLQFPTR